MEELEVEEGERHRLPVESIKVIAESIGISGLGDEVCKRLSEDLEYRLTEIAQNSVKFMRQCKRRQLVVQDIDHALKLKNIAPIYGLECTDHIPLRHASGGGKEIYYPDEQEVDLVDLISSPLPKLPCEVSLRTHWLAVEGVQPVVPENLPPITLAEQREQAVASVGPSDRDSLSKDVRLDRKRKKDHEEESADWTKLKPLSSHWLSQEQQLYYRELTDTVVGACVSDAKRQEAYTSLATDPGLYQLLPNLVNFVMEGLKVNLAQRKLLTLKHLLKMIKALLENMTVSLEKYLHDIIPPVASCLLNNAICPRPESEDHWSTRDLAARILAQICRRYSNSVNNVQIRLTRILSQVLKDGSQGLAAQYGAIMGFVELGTECVTNFVLPQLKVVGEAIKAAQLAMGASKVVDQVAASKLQVMIQKHCSPSAAQAHSPSDTVQSYQNDYGHLGTVLYNQVKAVRQGRPALQLSAVQRSVKQPTSPLGVPLRKARPPPLSLNTQVTATKIQTPRGTPLSTLSLPSPTLGTVRLQITPTHTQGGAPLQSPLSATIPVSLLSAVVNSPAAQAVLAGHLSGETSRSEDTPTTTVPTPITTSNK